MTTTTITTAAPVLPYNHGGNSKVEIIMIGNFGGGTLTWSKKWSDGTYRDIPGAAYTSDDAIVIDAAEFTDFKATLAGSTGASIDVEFVSK